MKIALVGAALSTRDQAPYDDPSWEIWSLFSCLLWLPRCDRLFELHDRSETLSGIYGRIDVLRSHIQRLRPRAVLVNPELLDMDSGTLGPPWSAFPFEPLRRWSIHSYLSSSMALLLAYALMTYGHETSAIGLWGVHLNRFPLFVMSNGSSLTQPMRQDIVELGIERACVEYWIGYAEAQGISIALPEASPLLRAPYIYGLETAQSERARRALDQRETELLMEIGETESELMRLERVHGQISARIDERAVDDPTGQRIGFLGGELATIQRSIDVLRSTLIDRRTRLSENSLRILTDTIGREPPLALEV